MNLSIALAVAWVFAATGVAMLPMRHQYKPGATLLFLALPLIAYLALDYGWIAGVGALAAFLSMFRKPLRFFWRRWRGLESGPIRGGAK